MEGLTLWVRCPDRMCFMIDRETLEAKTGEHFDSFCFSDPNPNREYMEYSDWVKAKVPSLAEIYPK